MVTEGSAVVLLGVPAGDLPVAAVGLLRSTGKVYAGSDLDSETVCRLNLPPAPSAERLQQEAAVEAIVVIAADATEPAAAALCSAGVPVINNARPAGTRLVEAALVMDRLRSPGGCPWDAAQTHDSLRQYLVEETYELLEAIETGDRESLLEELGDVLLQVLFHARVASEDSAAPFDIDDVAQALIRKLVSRHPHVFGDGDRAVHDAASQQVRWEELKQEEKQRKSIVDGVALGQPAVSLAAKLVQRAKRAGFPDDLLPTDPLFAEIAWRKRTGADPEGELRGVARRFADDVREAERAARAAGINLTQMDEHTWRQFWPDRGI